MNNSRFSHSGNAGQFKWLVFKSLFVLQRILLFTSACWSCFCWASSIWLRLIVIFFCHPTPVNGYHFYCCFYLPWSLSFQIFNPTVLFAVFSHSSVLAVVPEKVSVSALYSLSSCLWCLIDPFTMKQQFLNTVIGAKGNV